MRHVLSGRFAEIAQRAAPGPVLPSHQHVGVPIFRKQADRLAVSEALLAAGTVFFAMLAHLQVTREIDDLANQRLPPPGVRLAVHSGADRGGRPWLRRGLS